jgi:site-specific DNA recombinase
VDRGLWDASQLLLRSRAVQRAPRTTKSAASSLTGRLFDESGQTLTPSHAAKGERRYRYYVSRGLIKGTGDSGGRGWRLPAPEIEKNVATAAGQILNDRAEIANAAQAIGLAENRLPSIFSAAEAWRVRLQSELEAGAALNKLVDRVDLTDASVRVSLRVPITDAGKQPIGNASELTFTRVFPMRIRRRGVEMRLVIEGSGALAARADLALLKAVARARQWSEDLLTGRAQSVSEVVGREQVSARYVRRLLRLAFLAPQIVDAIAAGHQPSELTAEALAERIELALLWTEQGQSRRNLLAGLGSITSAPVGQVNRRIDPIVRQAWMEPPHLPTENLGASRARATASRLSPVPLYNPMTPQLRAISAT